MIEKENENEKYYAIFKIVAIGLINIVIGFFVIFFFALSRVNAATWAGVYDKSDVTNSTNGNNEGTSTYAFYGSTAGTSVPVVIPGTFIFKPNLNQLGLGVIQTGDFKQNTQYEFEISFKAQIGIWGPSALDWAMGGKVLLGNMAGVEQNISNRSFTRTGVRTTTRKFLGKTVEVNEATYTLSGTFTASMNQTRISFLFPNNTASNLYNGIFYKDIQISINSLNTDKTNGDIINNNNSNTNKVINNQNQNTQEIIENQNENNQQVLDAFDQTWNICESNIVYTVNPNNLTEIGYLTSNGSINGNTNFKISDYYETGGGETTIINTSTSMYSPSFCFYDKNKTLISCQAFNNEWNITVTNPNNAYYIRTSVNNASNVIITTSYCRNRIDVQVEWEEDNNKTLKDILGGITSSDVDDPDNDLNDMSEQMASDSALSDLLLLPVTLYQSVLNNINGTCSSFNLGSLFGTNLTMPCINISSFFGNVLYNTIDVLISGFFILSIRKKFVDIFENLTSLRTGGNELE